jgi:hypothetical protein
MSRPTLCRNYGETLLSLALLIAFSSPVWSQENHGVFGNAEQSQAAMIGILYDFKQTQNHTPTGVDSKSYLSVLDDFFSHGWDEKRLDRYYRVSRPLYTTQIFIPLFDADEAPREFGVERTVQPSRWIVHYKAQVSAPTAGTYRFVGYADDVIVVAVNQKPVLDGSRGDSPLPGLHWRSSEPLGAKSANGKLTYGDWMDLAANEIIDLDIIVGERPGGFMGAFLLVQQQGANYASDASGNPILPIFQVAPYDTPSSLEAPEFAQGFPIWKSYQ